MGHGDRTPEPKPIRQLLEEDENLTFEGSLDEQEEANVFLNPNLDWVSEEGEPRYVGGQDRFTQEQASQQAIQAMLRTEYYDARYRALELAIEASGPGSSAKTIINRAKLFLEFLKG